MIIFVIFSLLLFVELSEIAFPVIEADVEGEVDIVETEEASFKIISHSSLLLYG